ncbi:MAG TPA: alpha/beta hydrolase [Candidatus Elarobacter sp.]
MTRSAGATARFHAVIDEALREIAGRDEDFLTRFPIALPDPKSAARKNAASLASWGWPADEMERVLERGNAYLRSRYKTIGSREETFFADWTGAALIDAYGAAGGAIPLKVIAEPRQPVRDVLETEYDVRSTAGGARYYARKKGSFPVVLINATGLPIESWRRLLCDDSHDYKLIVPVRSHGDIFAGGVEREVSCEEEAREIVSVVEDASSGGVHVLAWCNGARLAVELATLLADRADSLTLLAPMFKGIDGVGRSLTRYERDLQTIFDIVMKDPTTAPVFAKKIAAVAVRFDWSKVSEDDAEQLDEIFWLPNFRNVELLNVPLMSGNSLVNVARRVATDETHPTVRRLSELRVPVMVVLGTHDNVVSNENTLNVLRAAGARCANVAIVGAGHDLHDLQYHYLRYVLAYFVDRRQPPAASARVRVLGRDESV